MISIPGNVPLAEGVNFLFPQTKCCNCGAIAGLRTLEQDTRQTTYLFGGGSEITFQLLLPFCGGCEKTAKRRPKNLFHRLLTFLVIFAVTFALVVGFGIALDISSLSQFVMYISFVVSTAASIGMTLFSRPASPQSSYFQPVRIRKLRREFLSGTIIGIRFGFTNKEYSRDFSEVNREAISKKVIEVVDA